MKLVVPIVAVASIACTVLITVALDLPLWTPIAFVLSFPLYYWILKLLSARALESWERDLERRAKQGEKRATAIGWLPGGFIVEWRHPRALLHARAGSIFRNLSLWPEASASFEAAYQLAPDFDRPRLAREVWSSLKKQRSENKPMSAAFAPFLEDALKAPDPPYDLYEDFADALMERGAFTDADLKYRSAIECAANDRQRFKLWCRLAIACVRDGRYGAGEGALHEAHELMPTGDPGYQSLYDRTADDVASAKRDAKSGQIHLVQLVRTKDRDPK